MDENSLHSTSASSSQSHRLKRPLFHQDPDYDEAAPPDAKHLKILEENARNQLGERVAQMLSNQFQHEVEQQHNEIIAIDESIAKVQQKLQVLRNVAARSYYSPKHLQVTSASSSQPVIHPSVKKLIGKSPAFDKPEEEKDDKITTSPVQECVSENVKVPRYVPPLLPGPVIAAPIRGEHLCLKKKLVIGNVSRWIPVSERDDSASHKWMVYVRGSKDEPNISHFVSQVVFFLHPSYAPHDVIHVMSHPFHVTRRGWGEFPLRVQVCFRNPLCKPVNIIHNLKLDQSYTGLQTLGAETVVEVMLYNEEFVPPESSSASEYMVTQCPDQERKQDQFADPVLEYTHLPPTMGSPEDIDDEGHGFLLNAEDCSSTSLMKTNDCSVPHPIPSTLLVPGLKIKAEPDDDGYDNPSFQLRIEQSLNCDDDSISSNEPSIQQRTTDCTTSSVIQGDHDYYQIKTESESTAESANATSCIVAGSVASSLSSKSMSNASSLSTALSSDGCGTSKPILVRCLSKNGSVIQLPFSLLRNYAVFKPIRKAKPGESLLRHPLTQAGQESSKAIRLTAIQPPQIEETPLSSSLSANPDTKQINEKAEMEKKINAERRHLRETLDAVEATNWSCVRDCVRVLVNNLRLVDERASDVTFRAVRPFSAPSMELFVSWNIGKQRSAEWSRAKLIRRTVEQCRFTNHETPWSTKEIMSWCRKLGYSPLACWPRPTLLPSTCPLNDQVPSTLSEIKVSLTPSFDDEDVSVEVESVDDSPFKPSSLSVSCVPKALLPLPDPDSALTAWLGDSVEKLGFKLGAEVFNGAMSSVARLLMSHLWKELASDLLRRSLSESWERNGGKTPDIINMSDALHSVIRRPEFDILTNSGLGIANVNGNV